MQLININEKRKKTTVEGVSGRAECSESVEVVWHPGVGVVGGGGGGNLLTAHK